MTWVRVPQWPKFFCANFFRLCETFFANISKGSTLHFFCLFCKRMDAKKLPKGPILHVSALCDLRETKKNLKNFKKNRIFFSIFPQTGTVEENTWHFEVLLLFLSLRYGADLDRSRLVIVYIMLPILKSLSQVSAFSSSISWVVIDASSNASMICLSRSSILAAWSRQRLSAYSNLGTFL